MQYEKLAKEVKNLLKIEKARKLASDKYQAMSLGDTTQLARAKASDRLNGLCEQLDRQRDIVHAETVNAGLCDPYKKDHYETQQITLMSGLGHSITKKYTPARPFCVSDLFK